MNENEGRFSSERQSGFVEQSARVRSGRSSAWGAVLRMLAIPGGTAALGAVGGSFFGPMGTTIGALGGAFVGVPVAMHSVMHSSRRI